MAARPVVLVVFDGWGIRERRDGNAIALARKPTWDRIVAEYPHARLEASGLDVGLRDGLMGNSEVGHMNIGAGRVMWQDITRIDRAIDDGSFYSRCTFDVPLEGTVHLMGLVSNGGVHSDEKHYFALLEWARRNGVPDARLKFHAFLDGRDTPPTSGIEHVGRLAARTGRIATIMGRYWAMDRDKRWERTEKAYEAIVLGEGRRAEEPLAAIREAYAAGETDEFVQPIVLDASPMRDGDTVIHFNFRADRTRQMTQALREGSFDGFARRAWPRIHFASMTLYREDWRYPVAFPPIEPADTLGRVISARGLKQFRIAETEKYAHVTFFFNGGSDEAIAGEERVLVPSPKVATYDLKPEMSAVEVTDRLVEAIGSGRFDFIVVNYANPDMVGHTGILSAAIRAVETVDGCLGRVLEAVRRAGGVALVTADHGNCEEMIDASGQPHTYHTTNPVPVVLVSEAHRGARLRDGSFKDVAPTVLALMGIPKPAVMEGKSLIS
jgi:2,3-bisphosphoglycerate-independent phosphoglycerate mutase